MLEKTLLLALLAALAGCGGKEDGGKGGAGSGAECVPGEFGNACDPIQGQGGAGDGAGAGGSGSAGSGGSAGVSDIGGGPVVGGSGGGGEDPSGWHPQSVTEVPEPPKCKLPAASNCAEKVLMDDVEVSDQASADALDGVTKIDGDLQIRGTAENLDALHCLREVTGELDVSYNDALKSLDGLRDLEKVGAWIDISDNDTTDIGCGFQRLADVGEHSFTPYIDIASSGFTALRFPALTRSGHLRIEDCPQLAVIEGPNELAEIGQFFIRSNDVLKQVSGFEGLESVGEIRIENNPALPVCDALLIIDRLVKKDGFSGTAAVGGNQEACK